MGLGIINGGLGLKLAANAPKCEIAYGVIAGVMAVTYAVLVAVRRKGKGAVRSSDGSMVVDGAGSRNRWGFKEKMGLSS